MNWDLRKLDSLLEKSGSDRAGKQDFPVLSITMRDGLIDQSEKFKKRIASKNTTKYRVAFHNELVVGFPIDEGVLGFQTKYPAGIVSPAYDIWKLKDPQETYIPYFERYLRSSQARRIYASKMRGAVARRRSLTKADFLGLEIPFPSLDDQKRIAHLLSKVEELIARRKQNLQQLDDLFESVFLDMFGDPERNEKGWDKPEFESILSGMRNGLSPSKIGKERGRVYTLSAITGDCFQEIFKGGSFTHICDKHFPSTRDFLVCRGNGNINLVGKGYFFPGISKGVIFPDTIIAVSILPNAINNRFMEALWKTRFIRKQIETNARTANGIHKINQGVIKNIKIIKPPDMLQNQFAGVAEKIDNIKSRYQQSLIDLETLYGALSQKAFKGELDLSRVTLPEVITGKGSIESPVPKVEAYGTVLADYRLPSPENLEEFRDMTGRKRLIELWFNAVLEQIDGKPFSVQLFLDSAKRKFWMLMEDDEQELGVAEYEELRRLIFEALASGRLQQTYNDAQNQVQIALPRG